MSITPTNKTPLDELSLLEAENLLRENRRRLRETSAKILMVEDAGFTVLSEHGLQLLKAIEQQTQEHIELLHAYIKRLKESRVWKRNNQRQ